MGWIAQPIPGLESFSDIRRIRALEFAGEQRLILEGRVNGIRTIATWNGHSIEALGLPRSPWSTWLYALADVGNGPELIVGGNRGLYRYTPPGFTSIGTTSNVSGFAAFDFGDGEQACFADPSRLYVGNQTTWTTLVTMSSGPCFPSDVLRWNDGGGDALYLCGNFARFLQPAIDLQFNGIAKLQGNVWSILGDGMQRSNTFCGRATPTSLAVYDDGAGPALFAGGDFDTAGGVAVSGVARWDGTQWSAVGNATAPFAQNEYVNTLRTLTYRGRNLLFAVGRFVEFAGLPTYGVMAWDGSNWTAVGPGPLHFGDREFWDIEVFQDDLYVVGTFVGIGNTRATGLAKFSEICADINHDGLVDLGDLALLLTDFGGPTALDDPDNDADFELNDLALLLSVFGSACP